MIADGTKFLLLCSQLLNIYQINNFFHNFDIHISYLGHIELFMYCDFFEGGEVNVSDIESILEKTGIELTDKECLELKKYLPVDGEHLK